MGIYKPGRPNKYNPSTGGVATNHLPAPANTASGITVGKCATSVKLATLIAAPVNIDGLANWRKVQLSNTRLLTVDPPPLRSESMSEVKLHSTIHS